ncbi:MAG: SdrD B-like domain-containing protein [Chloroflexota bacterium]
MTALIIGLLVLSFGLVGIFHLTRRLSTMLGKLSGWAGGRLKAKTLWGLILSLILLVASIIILQHTNLVRAQSSGLTVEILAGYNLVVDSNVQSPSTFGPSAATVAARVCNTSGSAITNAAVFIGDFAAKTPGLYPSRSVGQGSFNTEHPALVDGGGSYAFTHEGGRLGLTDATRQLGNLAAGQCVVQYWTVSYPRCENVAGAAQEPACTNDAVWGDSVKPSDDLYLSFDVWATGKDAADATVTANQSWTMHLRNEISAMANKIEPNGSPGGTWFNTNPGTVQVGGVITTNGILYRIGNVRFGFDNDRDYLPDYNFWLQPIGDPDQFDSGCFRLIRTSGVITVEGQSATSFSFTDQLYFTRPQVPEDNTNVIGEVFYTFLALGTQCLASPTPYQEAASGYDNEKFNGDFGAGGSAPIDSGEVIIGLDKSGTPGSVVLGEVISYTIPFINNGSKPAGLLLYNGAFVNTPLVISDSIPAGAQYQAGSATYTLTAPKNGVKILFSTDNGQTWSETEPVPASSVTNIQWWLQDPLDPNDSGAAKFSILIPSGYTGAPVVENCADAQFGNGPSVNRACETTNVQGNNIIGNEVWQDDDADGLRDPGEPYLNDISVSLFWDKNGDGALDGNDVLMLTTTTGITATGFYTFSNLLNGDYLVQVDRADADIPFGYSATTAHTFAVTLSGNNYLTADFGFGPALSVSKTLLTTPVYEGRTVAYRIDVTNLRPGDGSGSPSACTFETWVTQKDAAHQSGEVWDNESFAFGLNEPNDQYAYTAISSQADSIAGTGFNLGSVPGNITKVEAVFLTYLNQPIAADDTVAAELYYNDVLASANTFAPAVVNTFQPGSTNKGFLSWDITALRSWQAADFNGSIVDLVLRTNKGTGPGGAVINMDGMGFRLTTDAQCGGEGDTLNPVPLQDTYNAGLLQFVSADPPQLSVTTGGSSPYANTGVIRWNNIGPLYGGQTKYITVTFKGLEPSPSPQTITNTADVTNAYFATGERANDDSGSAVTPIAATGLISGVVWSDVAPTGWQPDTSSLPGYDANDFFIPGVTVTLRLCAVPGTTTPLSSPASNKTCAGNGGQWTIVGTQPTDQNGRYAFEGLLDGFYYVTVDPASLPDGSGSQTAERNDANTAGINGGNSQWGNDAGNLNTTNFDPLNGAENITNINFGYTVNPALYGYIWQDYNADGVIGGNEPYLDNGAAGITVTLVNSTTGAVIATTQTGADGRYQFTGLDTVTAYRLVVDTDSLPGGASAWSNTFDPDGLASPDSRYNVGVLSAGQISGPYNFGYRGNADIGDTVYYDWNGDGSQGVGENGIPNITVYLYRDTNGDGLLNSGDTLVLTDTTNAAGNYLFANVSGDDWIVVVDESALTAANQTGDPDGVMDGKTALTSDGINNALNADFGFQPVGAGAIGDLVWKDMDGNGILGGSRETGLAAISVTLYIDNGDGSFNPAADALVAQTSTDGSGAYLFTNLISATYFVDVATDDPQLPQDAFGNLYRLTTNNDPHKVTLTTGQTYLLADFGFAPPARVGDFIYQDNNKNGEYDLGEPGLDGVPVTLYTDVNGNGQYDSGTDTVYSTTTTVNGLYNFTGLPAGDYVIVVNDAALIAGSYTRTGDPDNVGGVCELTDTDGLAFNDCNAETGFNLRLGQTDITRDFGYLPPRSIGDLVWLDSNGNGLQDSGERGLGGITVTVTLPGGGSFTTYTDNQGYYSFGSNVLGSNNGNFTVSIDAGPNYTPAYDFDGTTVSPDGQTTIAINSTGFFTDVLDFGYKLNGSKMLTGTVFFDSGGAADTITDTFTAGDSPYQNITVILYDSAGVRLGDAPTSAGGYYTFTNLFENSDYTVVVQKNSTLQPLTLSARPDSSVSSIFSLPTDSTLSTRVTVAMETTDVGDIDFGFSAAQPVLNISKAVQPAGQVAPGDTLTYTLVVANNGDAAATYAVISDTLPAEVNLVSVALAPPGAGITSTTPPALASGLTITAGERITLTVVVTVDAAAPAGTVITNVAAVTSAEVSTQTSAPVTNTIAASQADLTLVKRDTPDPVTAGQTLTYTLVYTNNGPAAAGNVYLTDTLPLSVTFGGVVTAPVGWSNPVTYNAGPPATLTWFTPTLAADASGEFVYTVTVDSAVTATFTNTAVITTDTPNSDPANNTAAEPTGVNTLIDLSLAKQVNTGAPAIGDTITFTVVVSNTGPSLATGVAISETLPNGYTYGGASATRGSYSQANGLWTVGALDAGRVATLTITAAVNAGGVYTNSAQVAAADQPDADSTPGNDPQIPDEDDDDEATVVPIVIDLQLTKMVDKTAVAVGDTVVFTVVISNAGPSTATGVIISDTLPVSLTHVSNSATEGSYDQLVTQRWSGLTLAAGEVQTLTITATVAASGVITNIAEVAQADQPDIDSTPNNHDPAEDDQAEAVITASGPAIGLAKLAGTVINNNNGAYQVPYTLTVENLGDVPLTSVQITDDLSSAFIGADGFAVTAGPTSSKLAINSSYTGVPPNHTLLAGGNTLAVSEVATVTFTVVVTPGANLGPYYNSAQVRGTTSLTTTITDTSDDGSDPDPDGDGNPGGGGENDPTPVQFPASPALAISKTRLSGSPVVVDDTVQFRLVVTNTGNITLATVPLTDSYNTAYLAFTAATPPPQDSANDGVLNWANLGPLAVGEKAVVTVTFRAVTSTQGLGGNVTTNTATTSAADTQGAAVPPSSDQDMVEIINPSFVVEKLVNLGQVAPNQTVTYTIRIVNTGDAPLTTINLTDTLAGGLTYILNSASPPETATSGQQLTWNDVTGGTALNPSQTLTITLQAAVTTTVGSYGNFAAVQVSHPTGILTDTDVVTVTVTDPAVTLQKDVAPPGAVNGLLTFTIRITNTGPSILDQIPLIDRFNGPIIYVGGAPQPDTIDNTNQALGWNDLTLVAPNGFGRNLAPGETFTITTIFSITNRTTEFTMTNVATVTGATDIFTNPASDDSDTRDLINVPTAIQLQYFRANRAGSTVNVTWATAVEIDNYGFRILRSAAGSLADAVELAFVPGEGRGANSGASYSYVDKTASPQTTYTYWLVDVDINGEETTHGPVIVDSSGIDSGNGSTLYLPLILK